jgi:hypothetical protein
LKGLTYEAIGAALCPEQPYTPQTVQGHLQRFQRFLDNPEDLGAYDQNRTSVLNALELELLRSLADGEAIQKASLRDRTIAFGTVFDKRRLEAGKSTENLGLLGRIVVESAKDLFVKPVHKSKASSLPENHNQQSDNVVDIQANQDSTDVHS